MAELLRRANKQVRWGLWSEIEDRAYNAWVIALVTAIVVGTGLGLFGQGIEYGFVGDASAQVSASAANIWVDTNGGTCTRSATPSEYNDAAACGSFNAANAICQNGDVVIVKGGNYATQTLTGSNGRTTNCTIQEAAGETVTIANGDLNIGSGAARIHTVGFTLTGNRPSGRLYIVWNASPAPTNIIVQGLKANRFLIHNGSNITLLGGVYGHPTGVDDPGTDLDNYENNKIENYGGTNPGPITLDGVTIRNMFCSVADCHGEGLYLHDFTNGLTIRNSIFYNNDFYNIFVHTANVDNVLLENNWFDIPLIPNVSGGVRNPSYGRIPAIEFKFDLTGSNWVIRNNSFHPQTGVSGGNLSPGISAIGNIIGDGQNCPSYTWSVNAYNVYESRACSGTGNTQATIKYVAAPSGSTYNANRGEAIDFRLTGPTWEADNRVPAVSCAATDMFGLIRPVDPSYCEAGAHERTSSTSEPSPTPTPGPGESITFATNSGGSSFLASDGTIYGADSLFTGGATASFANPIANTTDDILYQSERYGNFSYDIPLANGTYELTLKFAEIFFTSTGSRVFHVDVEGTRVLSNLDIYDVAGADTAYDRTFTVSVADGTLNINFISVVNNAKISAIKVAVSADTTAPSAPSNLSASVISSSRIDLSWTASTDNVGVSGYKVERCSGSSCTNFSQIATTTTTSYSNTGLSASTVYRYRVRAYDAAGNNSAYSSIVDATTQADPTPTPTPTPEPTGQTPYSGTPYPIPGIIEAENFDHGGQGVAYYDTDSGNNGGAYRDTDVDIKALAGRSNGHVVAWIATGEWLEYTVSVGTTGTYTLELSTASVHDSGRMRIEFNGEDKTGQIVIPNTGSWETFTTVTKTGISLTAGTHIMRIFADSQWFDIDYFKFSSATTDSTPTPTPTSDTTPPTINSWDVQPRQHKSPNRTVSWNVSDSGGSFLSRVEIQRALYNASNCNDSTKTGCAWSELATVYAPVNVNSWSSNTSVSQNKGTYWYGLHVLDNAGNRKVESAPIKVVR
jgi:hypothetical protein